MCGLLVLLSVTWSVPQRVPFWEGQNDTLMVELWPGCKVVPETLLHTLKSPVHFTLVMHRGWLPPFEMGLLLTSSSAFKLFNQHRCLKRRTSR